MSDKKKSLTDASKEELISIVKQLHSRLQTSATTTGHVVGSSSHHAEQAAAAAAARAEFEARIGSLQEQAKLLKGELATAQRERTALEGQVKLLTEKSATDEDTIQALIQQIEMGQQTNVLLPPPTATTASSSPSASNSHALEWGPVVSSPVPAIPAPPQATSSNRGGGGGGVVTSATPTSSLPSSVAQQQQQQAAATVESLKGTIRELEAALVDAQEKIQDLSTYNQYWEVQERRSQAEKCTSSSDGKEPRSAETATVASGEGSAHKDSELEATKAALLQVEEEQRQLRQKYRQLRVDSEYNGKLADRYEREVQELTQLCSLIQRAVSQQQQHGYTSGSNGSLATLSAHALFPSRASRHPVGAIAAATTPATALVSSTNPQQPQQSPLPHPESATNLADSFTGASGGGIQQLPSSSSTTIGVRQQASVLFLQSSPLSATGMSSHHPHPQHQQHPAAIDAHHSHMHHHASSHSTSTVSIGGVGVGVGHNKSHQHLTGSRHTGSGVGGDGSLPHSASFAQSNGSNSIMLHNNPQQYHSTPHHHNHSTASQPVTAGGGTATSTSSMAQQFLQSLPEIQLRGVTPREKKLLERLKLLEDHITTTDSIEANRLRHMEDVEQQRAELIGGMRQQLATLKAEGKRLRAELSQVTSQQSLLQQKEQRQRQQQELPSHHEDHLDRKLINDSNDKHDNDTSAAAEEPLLQHRSDTSPPLAASQEEGRGRSGSSKDEKTMRDACTSPVVCTEAPSDTTTISHQTIEEATHQSMEHESTTTAKEVDDGFGSWATSQVPPAQRQSSHMVVTTTERTTSEIGVQTEKEFPPTAKPDEEDATTLVNSRHDKHDGILEAETQQQLQQLRNEIAELHAELEEQRRKSADREARFSSATTAIRAIKERGAEASLRAETLQEQLTQEVKSREDLQTKLREHVSRVHVLEAQGNKYRQAWDQSKERIDELIHTLSLIPKNHPPAQQPKNDDDDDDIGRTVDSDLSWLERNLWTQLAAAESASSMKGGMGEPVAAAPVAALVLDGKHQLPHDSSPRAAAASTTSASNGDASSWAPPPSKVTESVAVVNDNDMTNFFSSDWAASPTTAQSSSLTTTNANQAIAVHTPAAHNYLQDPFVPGRPWSAGATTTPSPAITQVTSAVTQQQQRPVNTFVVEFDPFA